MDKFIVKNSTQRQLSFGCFDNGTPNIMPVVMSSNDDSYFHYTTFLTIEQAKELVLFLNDKIKLAENVS